MLIKKWLTAAAYRFVATVGVAVSAALIISACQQSPMAPASVGNGTGVPGQGLAVKAAKVDVCHREGNGSFHLINVSGNALPAHLAHGDGQPGGGVPGDPNKEFDGACGQVDVGPRTTSVGAEACGQTINLSCPSGTVISVTQGLYGQNCVSGSYTGDNNPDKTAHLAAACDDLTSCNYVIDCSASGIGDPFFLCPKTYQATWTCVAE